MGIRLERDSGRDKHRSNEERKRERDSGRENHRRNGERERDSDRERETEREREELVGVVVAIIIYTLK